MKTSHQHGHKHKLWYFSKQNATMFSWLSVERGVMTSSRKSSSFVWGRTYRGRWTQVMFTPSYEIIYYGSSGIHSKSNLSNTDNVKVCKLKMTTAQNNLPDKYCKLFHSPLPHAAFTSMVTHWSGSKAASSSSLHFCSKCPLSVTPSFIAFSLSSRYTSNIWVVSTVRMNWGRGQGVGVG